VPLLLVLLFIAVPIAELYVIYLVGDAIGVLPTLAILAVDSILGAVLLRSQGRAAWRRFVEATQAGRMPGNEALDGVLVIFGGAFLLTPGFLTDFVGLFLLVPPTRALIRRFLVRRLGRRLLFGVAGATVARGRRRSGRNGFDDWDVEGSATEYEAPHDPPPRLER
jgi:UPF0716 protein FxsA